MARRVAPDELSQMLPHTEKVILLIFHFASKLITSLVLNHLYNFRFVIYVFLPMSITGKHPYLTL